MQLSAEALGGQVTSEGHLGEIEILLTIAEIAVAFAGFATLASILGRRYSRDDPRLDAIRLRNMLDTSLATVGLALIPILPMKLGLSPGGVWRICSLIFLGVLAAISLAVRGRTRELIRLGVSYSRPFTAINSGMAALIAVALAANVLGITGPALFPTYYGALVFSLVIAGLLFIRILGSLLATPSGE